MLAVLQDAVVCFQEHAQTTCKRKQAMHRDAEDWILNRDQIYPSHLKMFARRWVTTLSILGRD